jgi:hypothetical protein
LEDLNTVDFENWFGILDIAPGLKYLVQLGSATNLVRGYIKGSQIKNDQYIDRCDDLVVKNLVNETRRLQNLTLTIFSQTDPYEIVFYLFDVALLSTKIVSQLHPIAFNCYNAGEFTYFEYYNIIVEENGYNPKNYIMNSIYNFGHIFDALRDAWFFIAADPRGQINNVYDVGFSIGWATYMIITPNLASYETDVNRRTNSDIFINGNTTTSNNFNELDGFS